MQEIKLDIAGAFASYTESVQEKIAAALKNNADEMLADTLLNVPESVTYSPKRKLAKDTPRSYSPEGIRYGRVERRTGTYRKGIVLKKLSGSRNRIVYGVINKTEDYRLNHLLDLGHKIPNGGRAVGTKFLTNAQKDANERLKRDIEKILEEG